MALLEIKNVTIKGISACVPPKIEETKDISLYSPEEVDKVIESTGVERKHIVSDGITASDLCLKACRGLINDLNWDIDSIDAICNVTQTSDYTNHPNVFVLHDKLNLKEDCLALDLFHGCPGWVLGLSSISSLMSLGTIKRALLFDGDILTSVQYRQGKESRPLFGDCGTATALEFSEEAPSMFFDIGTNSKDGVALIHKRGGARSPHTLESYDTELKMLSGELSTEGVEDLMDGMSVFSFGITTPPKSIKKLCEHYQIDLQGVDKVILHQANLFMVNTIIKKLKIDPSKAPSCLKDYGNTSSTSIPLTIISQCNEEYSEKNLKTICCGFGTGLSWGSAYFETNKIVCPKVIIYDENV
jgi:3-oxoacyl-[acyl-carrier-protein] synthase-3